MVIEIKCEHVWREISNYLEGDLAPQLRQRLEAHFESCPRCAAVLNGTRNIVRLAGDGQALDVPDGFGKRLYAKLRAHLEQKHRTATGTGEIALGITDDHVPLGSHLLYFWQNDEEFERGIRFLEAGLKAGEHCVLQGHEEVNAKAFAVLRATGYDPEKLVAERRLTVLGRRSGAEMMSDVMAVFEAAMRVGASAIRFLGNLGIGREPLPGGENDVQELEARTTAIISQFPCVLVCMYDVRTLPGRMILNCGLRTHPLTVGEEGVRENPYFTPGKESFPGLRHVH